MANNSEFMIKEVESFDRTVSIKQEFSGELGATVWDAALVLCKYFENIDKFPPGYFKNKKVLELGAGTAVVGIVLGLLGAHVTVTDQAKLLGLINENIEINHIQKNVIAKELNWGEDASANLNGPFDIIVASDLIANCYATDLPKLISSIEFNSSKKTDIFLSYEKRDLRDVEFFKLLKEKFDYTKIPDSQLDPVWRSEDIGIFLIKKK